MPIEPMEPEGRASLIEFLLGIAAALIVAPGVIWWAITLWSLVKGLVQ